MCSNCWKTSFLSHPGICVFDVGDAMSPRVRSCGPKHTIDARPHNYKITRDHRQERSERPASVCCSVMRPRGGDGDGDKRGTERNVSAKSGQSFVP